MNQREKLTKMLLKQGLIRLLKQKNINRINVKELCAEAGLNRSTFYLHYDGVFHLLEELEQEIIGKTKEYLSKIEADNDSIAYIRAFLDHIQKNGDLYTLMLLRSDELSSFPKRLINEVLNNIDNDLRLNVPEQLKDYIYAYLVNGSLSIMQEWIRREFTVSSSEIANLIYSLADSSMQAFMSRNE
ncbi:TetR/AcrR family transcriptional regulator [Saccharibacillus endophyticus]|uniref:TetR family transcriptional regulator n=1 Tax=Saccharibacillus endophyticus TaxID=2060666 RepID=A0ABQ1ZMT8_9BACL|nr:TetR/AcrR family transcriptional regulator [Saccharibacillus endophyticus]GGH69655.1 TetR family transcriptional regulator [Saccharibacillus endophyticus]